MTLTRIPHSQEYHSNVAKYLNRASRSNTGTFASKLAIPDFTGIRPMMNASCVVPVGSHRMVEYVVFEREAREFQSFHTHFNTHFVVTGV